VNSTPGHNETLKLWECRIKERGQKHQFVKSRKEQLDWIEKSLKMFFKNEKVL
jgi:hypothetical protein